MELISLERAARLAGTYRQRARELCLEAGIGLIEHGSRRYLTPGDLARLRREVGARPPTPLADASARSARFAAAPNLPIRELARRIAAASRLKRRDPAAELSEEAIEAEVAAGRSGA